MGRLVVRLGWRSGRNHDARHRIGKALRFASTALVSAMACAAGGAARPASPPLVDRNTYGFVLTIEHMKMVGGGWTGDADFTLSDCPRNRCFQLSGPIRIASAPQSETSNYEGVFPVPGTACAIRFEEILYGGMDSGDYRLTLVSQDGGAKGCSALPAGLAGVYKQVVKPSLAEGRSFQVLAGPAFDALARRTDAACPDAHARFFNAGDLAWEEESFEDALGPAGAARIGAAIERTPDGAPRSCENANGLSCAATTELEAIAKGGEMKRFAAFLCANRPPQ